MKTLSKCCGKEVRQGKFNIFCRGCSKICDVKESYEIGGVYWGKDKPCEVVEEPSIDKALNKYEKALDKIQPPTESWEAELEGTKAYRVLLETKFGKKLTHNLKLRISKFLSQAEARHRENLKNMVVDVDAYFDGLVLIPLPQETRKKLVDYLTSKYLKE